MSAAEEIKLISELVKAAKVEGRAEEREECAKIAESFHTPGLHIPVTIAELIRKRSDK